MFDLNQEIRSWRRSMSARIPFHHEAIAELESHLRDAVQKQIQNGSTPEAAWTMALAQLGSLDAIAAEYGKLPKSAVWRWLPVRVVLGVYTIFALMLAWVVGSRMLMGRADLLLAIHVLTISLGYAAVFSAGAIAAWSILSRAFHGWSPAQTEVLGRATGISAVAALALTWCGVVFGALWFRNHAGLFWSWDPREIGGIVVMAWNVLVLALLVRGNNERLGMLLGLMGNALVALCWLTPIMFPGPGAHLEAVSTVLIRVAIVGTVALVTLFGLALLPEGRLRFRHST